MHKNSLEAFKAITADGSRDGRKRLILEFLLKHSTRFYSDYHIMIALGFTDMNKIRPRISDMYRDPTDNRIVILEEGPPVKSHDGNLNVRTSRIRADLISEQTGLF